MIEISATTAFMIYLCLSLVVILGIWGMQHYRGRKKKIVIIEQEVYVCEYCQFCYLREMSKPVTRCPQCKSFNREAADKIMN